jgi:hypothetical protein
MHPSPIFGCDLLFNNENPYLCTVGFNDCDFFDKMEPSRPEMDVNGILNTFFFLLSPLVRV